jgi:hypothetical protein
VFFVVKKNLVWFQGVLCMETRTDVLSIKKTKKDRPTSDDIANDLEDPEYLVNGHLRC